MNPLAQLLHFVEQIDGQCRTGGVDPEILLEPQGAASPVTRSLAAETPFALRRAAGLSTPSPTRMRIFSAVTPQQRDISARVKLESISG